HQQSRARKPLPGGSSMRVQNQQGEATQIRQRANRDSKALSARQQQNRVGEILDRDEHLQQAPADFVCPCPDRGVVHVQCAIHATKLALSATVISSRASKSLRDSAERLSSVHQIAPWFGAQARTSFGRAPARLRQV